MLLVINIDFSVRNRLSKLGSATWYYWLPNIQQKNWVRQLKGDSVAEYIKLGYRKALVTGTLGTSQSKLLLSAENKKRILKFFLSLGLTREPAIKMPMVTGNW